jgi:hypothetical protein
VSAADRAIRVSTAAAVLGVAGIAAYLSYWHAYEVVRAHGESGVTARLEPATIDGLVYASSMVVLYAARHRLPVPALARWLLALGIVATLAANVAHGWAAGPAGAAVALAGPDRRWRRHDDRAGAGLGGRACGPDGVGAAARADARPGWARGSQGSSVADRAMLALNGPAGPGCGRLARIEPAGRQV